MTAGLNGSSNECCYYSVLQEAKIHMKRCIESGLWVPNSRDGDKDEDGTYEEVKQEAEENKNE